MPVVVDASVTLAWCLSDEHAEVADVALGLVGNDGCIVPPIWWYEVRNVLVLAERRGRLRSGDYEAFMADLRAIPTTIETDWQSNAIVEIARTHGLTIYDAAYVELARRHQATLATLDARLAAAATALSVPLVLPS